MRERKTSYNKRAEVLIPFRETIRAFQKAEQTYDSALYEHFEVEPARLATIDAIQKLEAALAEYKTNVLKI